MKYKTMKSGKKQILLAVCMIFVVLHLSGCTFAGSTYENSAGYAAADGELFLTEDEAYQSVYNYLDQLWDMDTVYEYHGYVTLGDATPTDYVILVRSYTGARGQFSVNKYTGEVYEQWMNPITDEWDPASLVYTITEEELPASQPTVPAVQQ